MTTPARTIQVDPVTRIEGHGKVTIELDESGGVSDAYLQVVEFRGFEKFCEGRMLWDMPAITSRICGFCPVSHHLASVKACEALLGVELPPTATKLRELLALGQFIQSHALHFFFCAMPDFLHPSEPAERNLFGMLEKDKELAGNAIKLRQAGQEIVDTVGGGRLHPVACIPGGMSKRLEYMDRIRLLKAALVAVDLARGAVGTVKDLFEANRDSFMRFASFPSHYMGLVKDGALELYDGVLRVVDGEGGQVKEFPPGEYLRHLEEKVDARSWMKGVYLKDKGPVEGAYRVASLARFNVADRVSTPLAAAAFQELKELGGGKPIGSSLFYHYARMVELLFAAERARDLLKDAEIMGADVRVPVERRGGEGVGVVEAPRGTLFHHYWANEDGRITKVNLLVSTAQNKDAINRSVTEVARSLVKDGALNESDLNQIEVAIRCYDPCLSCSTHAYGRMPLEVTLVSSDGNRLATYRHGDLSG